MTESLNEINRGDLMGYNWNRLSSTVMGWEWIYWLHRVFDCDFEVEKGTIGGEVDYSVPCFW